MTSRTLLRPLGAAGAVLLVGAALYALPVRAGEAISPAENALFLSNHFTQVREPAVLRYEFAHSGSLERPFSDAVNVAVAPDAGGNGHSVTTHCFSGSQRIDLPTLEHATGNPALLCFLERDIREMERLTGGKAHYFRKRIRLALADKAEMRPVRVAYGGEQIEAREIRIAPYVDDPMKPRFEKYTGKTYVFRLSDEVPGGIVDITSRIPDAAAGADLIAERLSFARAERRH